MHASFQNFFRSLLLSVSLLMIPCSSALSKSIFLNGTDISNLRGQHLKKVDVFIDPKGNIIIQAPHYQVHLVDHFVPLQYPLIAQPSGIPTHRSPQALSESGLDPSPNISITGPTPGTTIQNNIINQPPSDSATTAEESAAASPSAKLKPSEANVDTPQNIPLENLDSNLEDERLTPKAGSKTVNE